MKTNMDYWDSVLKNLPKSYHQWFEEERKYLQRVVTTDAKVLEVGCGDGRSIFDLLPVTKHIVGIDHDDTAIADAKQAFAHEPTIQIFKADATHLPFQDSEFDFVICMTTFANFADKKFIVLDEMKRVLKPTGKIIISVFSEDAFEERMKVYKSVGVKIKEIRGTTVVFDESVGDHISEQFTQEQLENIFTQASLQILDITKVNMAYLCTLIK
ncbi:MAG: class I SAM-dependent methyltransferase [Candidatus Kerfeldbacteria bacterium]|nr:class I SAM-dependent methyltransferase [Candidatus Kerfeldbacteria bacterium]